MAVPGARVSEPPDGSGTVLVELKEGEDYMEDAPGAQPRARIYPKTRGINHYPYEAYLGEILLGTFNDISEAVFATYKALRESGTYSDIHYLMPRSDVTLLGFTRDAVETAEDPA
jgi:hypothetical protein